MKNTEKLIFVIEDDLPCGMLIKYYLAKNNYRNIYLFSNEKECLLNMSRHPDIIITDYRLKSMNGLNLIKKAKEKYPYFYCIMLSGMSGEEIFGNDLNSLFIDKFIRKNLNSMNELILSIKEYLEPQYLKRG